MAGMLNMCKITIDTCAVIVEVNIAIFLDDLLDKPSYIINE